MESQEPSTPAVWHAACQAHVQTAAAGHGQHAQRDGGLVRLQLQGLPRGPLPGGCATPTTGTVKVRP